MTLQKEYQEVGRKYSCSLMLFHIEVVLKHAEWRWFFAYEKCS